MSVLDIFQYILSAIWESLNAVFYGSRTTEFMDMKYFLLICLSRHLDMKMQILIAIFVPHTVRVYKQNIGWASRVIYVQELLQSIF